MAKRKSNTGDALAAAGARDDAGLFGLFDPPSEAGLLFSPAGPSEPERTTCTPGPDRLATGADDGPPAPTIKDHPDTHRPASRDAGETRTSKPASDERIALQPSVEYRTLTLSLVAFGALEKNLTLMQEWDTTYRGELLVMRMDYNLHNTPGDFLLIADLVSTKTFTNTYRVEWRFENLRPIVPVRGKSDFCIDRFVMPELPAPQFTPSKGDSHERSHEK